MSSVAGAAVAPAAAVVDDDADSEYDAAWMCGAAWTQVLQDAELTGKRIQLLSVFLCCCCACWLTYTRCFFRRGSSRGRRCCGGRRRQRRRRRLCGGNTVAATSNFHATNQDSANGQRVRARHATWCASSTVNTTNIDTSANDGQRIGAAGIARFGSGFPGQRQRRHHKSCRYTANSCGCSSGWGWK